MVPIEKYRKQSNTYRSEQEVRLGWTSGSKNIPRNIENHSQIAKMTPIAIKKTIILHHFRNSDEIKALGVGLHSVFSTKQSHIRDLGLKISSFLSPWRDESPHDSPMLWNVHF